MIPIILVSGFLGSGKTSLLKNLVKFYPQKKLAFIINEFSDFNVDSYVLAHENTIGISGGNIFCKCKVENFIEAIKKLSTLKCDAIIIECSGISDPNCAGDLFQIFEKFAQGLELAKSVCVVDCLTLPKILKTLPVSRAQIESADIVLINKIDLISKSEVEKIKILTRSINSNAKIITSKFCDTNFDLFTSKSKIKFSKKIVSTPEFDSYRIEFKSDVNPQTLIKMLSKYTGIFLRIKGFFNCKNKKYHLEYDGVNLNIAEFFDEVQTALVFISDPKESKESTLAIDEFLENLNAS